MPKEAPAGTTLRLPVWAMGLTMASFGAYGGVWAIATPQLLAADHVPEPKIATISTLALLPGVFGFLLCPILDVWITRRAWATISSLATGGFIALALIFHHDLRAFTALLIAATLMATLYQGALGGWLASLVGDDRRATLGAWTTVGNIGGGGLMAMIAVPLLRALPSPLGPIVLGALIVAPIAPFAWLPAPPPDSRLSHEGFVLFLRDVRTIIVQPRVLRILLLFAAPSAAFALTNILGGFGAQYRASESFVSVVGGAGVMVAGIAGSLIVPPLVSRLPPVRVYLLIGVVGALFSAGLCLAPHRPWTLAAALLGENIFQSAAFAAANAITYWSLGRNNPLASTQVAVLTAATVASLTYMQLVDGHAYDLPGLLHGPAGSLIADAAISLVACLALFWGLRRLAAEPAPAGAEAV